MKYELTPVGWQLIYVNEEAFPSDGIGPEPLDSLLLTMTKMGKNALIWTGKEWTFEEVKYVNKNTKTRRK